MTGWRRWIAGVGLLTAVALFASACRIDGTAEPDAAAMISAQSSPISASSAGGTPDPDTGPAGPSTTGTIEDYSTNLDPPTTGPSSPATGNSTSLRTTPVTTAASGPTVIMASDGYAVSILVTTIWAQAMVGKGARVGVRTIDSAAAQFAALRAGQIDIVQQCNSDLLDYLDADADTDGQSAVDAAIASRLPAGLTVLRSTPAKDDVQLVVSAATAAKYRLHSITDLADHLADLTLLTDKSAAKSIADGLSNFYGLTFPDTRITDFAGPTTIAAIKAGRSVGLMVASQYQIDDNHFVALTDPKHLFLTENFIPVVGKKVSPAMRATLNAVSAKLTLTVLRGLRKKVATGPDTVTEVADEWLASVGLR